MFNAFFSGLLNGVGFMIALLGVYTLYDIGATHLMNKRSAKNKKRRKKYSLELFLRAFYD